LPSNGSGLRVNGSDPAGDRSRATGNGSGPALSRSGLVSNGSGPALSRSGLTGNGSGSASDHSGATRSESPTRSRSLLEGTAIALRGQQFGPMARAAGD